MQIGVLVPHSIASVLAFLLALAASAALIASMRRILPVTFLAAGVNERSAHIHPARQIGGLGLVPAAIAAFALVATMADIALGPWLAPGFGMLILWLLGYVDDRRPLGPSIKLAVQIAAAAIVIFAGTPLPAIFPMHSPTWNAVAAFVVLVGFVNMVNFMDGMDLMSVAGTGPAIFFTGLLAFTAGDGPALLAALAICGALAGFGLHNRPPASVFLGDSGSLPLGLLAGYLTLRTSAETSLLITFLPFGYYLGDTMLTVIRRALGRKNLLRAHSEHAYQDAGRAGLSPTSIAARVALTGLASGSAALFAANTDGFVSAIALVAGWATVLALIAHFRRA